MVSGNVLLDMLLSDSSSDDNSAVFIMLAFLHQKRLNRRKRSRMEEERLNRRKRSRIRPLRPQSRSLPRPFIPSSKSPSFSASMCASFFFFFFLSNNSVFKPKVTSGTVEKLTIQSEEDMQHQQTADTWQRRESATIAFRGSDLPCLFTVSGQPPLRRDIRHQGEIRGLDIQCVRAAVVRVSIAPEQGHRVARSPNSEYLGGVAPEQGERVARSPNSVYLGSVAPERGHRVARSPNSVHLGRVAPRDGAQSRGGISEHNDSMARSQGYDHLEMGHKAAEESQSITVEWSVAWAMTVLKHGGGNDASDSCSSSSDPELQANNDDVVEVGEYDESLSYSSGYEGEDSSADEVDVNSSGSLTKDDDIGIKDGGQGDANVVNTLSNTVAKETGHARSEILLNKGRLRLIRNSVGEVEGEVNAGAERRARIAAAALVDSLAIEMISK
ncbi:hypothetical protein RHSIM_Rhsim10G0075600 [Rhododendron simsii]|uniref:Uncharacterized protein n=1 Tax=Rhododendron simsii TaxID=118357 RepID=A0A834G9U7_RHOSS|nr:hypothetical protein RHSIM_Rhsim10G0075600 [Rhododendron simsii]